MVDLNKDPNLNCETLCDNCECGSAPPALDLYISGVQPWPPGDPRRTCVDGCYDWNDKWTLLRGAGTYPDTYCSYGGDAALCGGPALEIVIGSSALVFKINLGISVRAEKVIPHPADCDFKNLTGFTIWQDETVSPPPCDWSGADLRVEANWDP